MLEQLYKEYGQLMIQLEILQGRVQECKRKIAEEINKPQQKQETKKDGEQ